MSETKEVVQFPAAVLECPICLEWFKDPRMLPACFHTLCYKCLKDLMETSQESGQFNCPVCRDSLQVPSDGAESFPKNFFMNNCLSVAARSQNETKSDPSGAAAVPEVLCGNAEETGDCDAAEKFCAELSRTSLTLESMTRQSEFGELWSGSLKEKVSIKVSKTAKLSREQLLTEANILQALRHRRILSLIGVCTTSEPLYIVTESLKRSLLSYLREDKGKTIQLRHMTNMAAQIAEGMAYLEMKGYAHKNLCADSIIVRENNCVKVAGFSRAIKLGGKTNQGITKPVTVTATSVRIKWTPPEVYLAGKFSTKSDVWSFGVLLYEMVTRGQEPYPGMDTKTTREKVKKGYRMPRPVPSPVTCPKELYEIMVSTWLTSPERRPTFEYLTTVFEDFAIATENPHENWPLKNVDS